MSITRIKPGRGIWVKCDGTDTTSCDEKRYTGNIVPKHNRAYWATQEGWGRGARSHTKSRDFCPRHLKHEQEAAAKQKAEKEERKKLKAQKALERAERKAAKQLAKSSPSAASAPAPST